MKSPFQQFYYKECRPKLLEQLGMKNLNRVPKLDKVVVAASPNEVVANSKALDLAVGERMYEFVNRLFNVALPRMRDFKGVSTKGFDGRGNYTLGIAEQIVFPEIPFDKIDKVRGMNITFVTTGRTDGEARALLETLGMPFRK